MAERQPTKTWIREFEEFTREFKNESDRAAVILGAAQLDNFLRKLLEGHLLPATGGSDELLEGDSPLSTFSARINICYRLGLISADFAKLLHIVRKIRNSFAHEVSGVSLNSGSHRDRIRDLIKPMQNNWAFQWLLKNHFAGADTPATEFRSAIALLSIRLDAAVSRIEQVSPKNAERPIPPPSEELEKNSLLNQQASPNDDSHPAAAADTKTPKE